MGTVKTDYKPQRSSSGLHQGPQRSSSGLHQGPGSAAKKSKLPKMTSAHRGRSGSVEPTPSSTRNQAVLSAFKTPRSRSANNRTPNSTRHPLSNLNPNSVMRGSMNSAKRSSIYAGGQKANTRPIADKDWQRQVVTELVEFCLSNDFPNQALSKKDVHGMSATTFR